MIVTVKFTPAMLGPETDLRTSSVVVIDTLRATSTLVTALQAGAREVIPVDSVGDAVDLAQRLGPERTLLCGERNGLKIDGFDLGNSPFEYTSEAVRDKTLVLTTTNGTVALARARHAAGIVCGSLLNASAVARYLVGEENERILLLCAGTVGEFSLEDAITAGAIVRALETAGAAPTLDDAGTVVRDLFQRASADLAAMLKSGTHGKRLIELGHESDIDFCARLDSMSGVPGVLDSTIKTLFDDRADMTG